jgi:hypothetical protein
VAQDQLEVVVALQNTFSIPLEISELSLITSGPLCDHISTNSFLPPKSVTFVKVAVVPKDVGILRIEGTRAKLFDCITRDFLAPTEAMHSQIALERSSKFSGIAASRHSQRASDTADPPAAPMYLEVEIVPPQPYLRLLQTNLRCGAVSLLAGETIPLILSVENASTLTIDSLRINCFDNLTHDAVAILSDSENELAPGLAFEIDYNLRTSPIFACTMPPVRIKPGSQKLLQIDCYGKEEW